VNIAKLPELLRKQCFDSCHSFRCYKERFSRARLPVLPLPDVSALNSQPPVVLQAWSSSTNRGRAVKTFPSIISTHLPR
jgi:hypothetical protein